MCVIVCHEHGLFPSINDLHDCDDSNPDGIGIAWQVKNGVAFHKGISFDEMLRYKSTIELLKTPYVLHFRIATIGNTGKNFCHPWPITANRRQLFALSGTVDGVLVHNGTWSDWGRALTSAGFRTLVKKQGWSDSAVMAYLIGRRKTVQFPKFGQRIATLSVKYGLKTFGGFEDDTLGIHYSNMYWKWSMNAYSSYYSNSEAKTLAAPPLPTVCDLESMRRRGEISKRKYKKLLKTLQRMGRTYDCVNDAQAVNQAYEDWQTMSYACIDKRCGDCSWRHCKHFCHVWDEKDLPKRGWNGQ